MSKDTGSCACQYIRYTTAKPTSCVVNCYCTICRKQSGAPFQSWAFYATDDIKWDVKPTERRSSDTATRSFCPRCGSTLSMVLDRDLKTIGIAAGTFDGRLPAPSHHIWTSAAVVWHQWPQDGAQRWFAGGHYKKI
ncbi:uncharacterized protein N7515_000808 [Penicillium bovifimosum]|uniref:CENP-V/GFA domain-containing protein n=1 Tax=Penicillium bovifimosum TaxID=126998 RepID=A0A9W9LA81_9EURO|nr:uncharacterized protein N7515_000808 [Penicillium bovifimosum]KAJ5146244.1 hypothetical protein N7515_000808 [Penicillium bovifimosum]